MISAVARKNCRDLKLGARSANRREAREDNHAMSWGRDIVERRNALVEPSKPTTRTRSLTWVCSTKSRNDDWKEVWNRVVEPGCGTREEFAITSRESAQESVNTE